MGVEKDSNHFTESDPTQNVYFGEFLDPNRRFDAVWSRAARLLARDRQSILEGEPNPIIYAVAVPEYTRIVGVQFMRDGVQSHEVRVSDDDLSNLETQANLGDLEEIFYRLETRLDIYEAGKSGNAL